MSHKAQFHSLVVKFMAQRCGFKTRRYNFTSLNLKITSAISESYLQNRLLGLRGVKLHCRHLKPRLSEAYNLAIKAWSSDLHLGKIQ